MDETAKPQPTKFWQYLILYPAILTSMAVASVEALDGLMSQGHATNLYRLIL